MTLRYNRRMNHIVCRWSEPVRIVMDGTEGVRERTRTINLRLNRNGTLRARDRNRHKDHPMLPVAEQFSNALRESGVLTCEGLPGGCACCRNNATSAPNYDMGSGKIIWACTRPACGKSSPRVRLESVHSD